MFVDTFDKTMAQGGFSERFLRQAAAANQRRADINAAKRMMHDRSAPSWVIERLLERAEKHGVSPALLAGKSRQYAIVPVREELIYSIKATKPGLSAPQIARWFGRDHTSILYSIAKHALNNRGVAALTTYDVPKRHASAAAFHARRRAEAML